MNLKAIERLCKQSKSVIIMNKEEDGWTEQWISDKFAIYPIYDAPYISTEHLQVMFNIPLDKWGDWDRRTMNMPETLPVWDADQEEREAKELGFSLYYRGEVLKPLCTQNGLVAINEKYLAPLERERQRTYFQRLNAGGQLIIAVKHGFLLQALIVPIRLDGPTLLDDAKTLYQQLKLAEEIAEEKKRWENHQQEIDEIINNLEETENGKEI